MGTDQSRSNELLERARRLRRGGQLPEARELLDANIPAAAGEAKAALLLERAQVALAEGMWRQAHRSLDGAMETLGPNGENNHWDLWLAIVERKAWTLFREGKLAVARALAEKLSRQIEERQDVREVTRAELHKTLGGIAWQQSRINDAIKHTRASVKLYEKAKEPEGAAHAHVNAGVLLYAKGRWFDAAEELARAEQIREQHGIASGRASNLINLASIEMTMGEHEAARRLLISAHTLAGNSGERYEAARAELALGHLDYLEHRLDAAWKRLDNLSTAAELMSDDDRVQAAWVKAMIECDRGSPDVAIGIASDALDVARAAQMPESQGDCCRALAFAYRRANNLPEAEQLLREAVALAEAAGDQYRRGLALLDLGEVCRDGRSVTEAATVFAALGARHDLQRAEAVRAGM
jgi:tetratricopeptide (TPR) repeat protein